MLIPSFFLFQKETMKNLKYFTKMFGSFKKTIYICQRQKVAFGYPGRIPRGSKTLSTLLHYFFAKGAF